VLRGTSDRAPVEELAAVASAAIVLCGSHCATSMGWIAPRGSTMAQHATRCWGAQSLVARLAKAVRAFAKALLGPSDGDDEPDDGDDEPAAWPNPWGWG
jgi:hypothetical protein